MMNMQSRNQYLKEVRTEYLRTKLKRKRGELLNEAEKRTNLNRKYLMDKLKPKSNLDKLASEKKKENFVKIFRRTPKSCFGQIVK